MFEARMDAVRAFTFLDFRFDLDECDLIVAKLSYLNWGAFKSPFTECADVFTVASALGICLPSVNSAAMAQFWSGLALMWAGAASISFCFISSSCTGLADSSRLWSVLAGET